jgi:hypothetical protein
VAELDERIIGFGLAVERERSWFLSFCSWNPASQASGIGRRLYGADPASVGVDAWLSIGGSLATCAEANQPIATGLYASLGMRPARRHLTCVGTPRVEALRRATAERGERPVSKDWSRRSVPTGWTRCWPRSTWRQSAHRRPIDHRDDRGRGSPRASSSAIVVDGHALGYGYVQPSGRIGPAYVIEPELLEGLNRRPPRTRQADRRLAARGARRIGRLAALLRAGLHFDEPPIVYCATGRTWRSRATCCGATRYRRRVERPPASPASLERWQIVEPAHREVRCLHGRTRLGRSVVGGGVGGTSVAYHLAELGWTDVVLLDRAGSTSGSTFHSAGSSDSCAAPRR